MNYYNIKQLDNCLWNGFFSRYINNFLKLSAIFVVGLIGIYLSKSSYVLVMDMPTHF